MVNQSFPKTANDEFYVLGSYLLDCTWTQSERPRQFKKLYRICLERLGIHMKKRCSALKLRTITTERL